MKKKTTKEPTWDQIGKAIGTKMEKESDKNHSWKSWNWKGCGNEGCGAIYGLGFLGALVYYISTATTFWMGVVGVLKAIVWPAFLVFGAMKFFGL